ncbi:MAG: tRNA (guanosine(46)-N7)-methyltransferase TrmB [Arenicella sp.]
MSDEKPFYRNIRSFVKREGKITVGQQAAIEQMWPQYGIELEQGLLDWSSVFGRQAPVVMEIGFGNGLSLVEMAEASPQQDFLGVEVHKPGLGSLLVQVKKRGLSNIRASHDDAVEVLQQIPLASLDRLQIFFPDPWHKKRHHKRRLIQAEFVESVVQRLKPGGVLHVATDWQNYAEHVMEVLMAEKGLSNQHDHYAPKPDYRPETKYERRGLKLGHGVWDILFERI